MKSKLIMQLFCLLLMLTSCQDKEAALRNSAREFNAQQMSMEWYVPLLNNIYDNSTGYHKKMGKWPATFEEMFPGSGTELTIRSGPNQATITLQRSLIHFKILSGGSNKTFTYEMGYGDSKKFVKEIEME